jgi:signal transduction histidine kinase
MEVPLGEPSGEMVVALSETYAAAGHSQIGPNTDSIRVSTEPNRKLGSAGKGEDAETTKDAGQTSPASVAPTEPPHPQDSLLPIGAKLMFSRAANIIRETSDLDGVVVFDASVAANRLRLSTSRRAPHSHRRSPAGTDDSDSSVGNPPFQDEVYAYFDPSQHAGYHSDVQKSRQKMSHILCFADGNSQSVAGGSAASSYESLAESDLKKVLDQYSSGTIINFDADGNASSTAESDHEPSENTKVNPKSPRYATKAKRKRPISEAIHAIAPGSRSVALLPLWDFERARWFAVCLFWTSNPHRILSQLDLTYFSAFGNTVMMELSRLDAINSNNTKTTFVASVSHELRSPLHGILGGVEFMQASDLNAFQSSMLNSIEMCGKTLLDTVDHVLDWSKISELTNPMARPRPRSRKRGRQRTIVSPLHSKSTDSGHTSLTSSLDLALSAEEVVEAVFSGMSYRVTSNRIDDYPKQVSTHKGGSKHIKHHSDANRKKVFILLEISERATWLFNTQPGAWRRIVMNIFGNALKYTESGFIRVSLTAQDATYDMESTDADDSSGTRSSMDSQYSPETRVTLTITDSGIGMSHDYLANKIYTPFSQENSFYAGTGLGLSIVRQLVESLGGSIDIKSQPRVGTEVRVRLTLPSSGVPSSPEENELNPITALKTRIQGKRVCVLDSSAGVPGQHHPGLSPSPATARLGPSLVPSLRDWLGVDVVLSEQWDKLDFDIVILTEVSFDFLVEIRSRSEGDKKIPLVIFVALDAIEASSVRNDSRILDTDIVVEIITQP